VTVGFHSPLPPARSGVADHAVHLLAALREQGRVEIEPRRAHVRVYHIGNNPLHTAIYERALREPGIVVLHDAVLHHFALGYFSRERYIEEFAYNYGEWSRGLAEELWAARATSAADARFFRYAMLKRLVETAHAVVVHNPAARQAVLDHCAAARVYQIPLLCPPAAPSPVAFRDELLCGVFGHLRASKRLSTIVGCCSKLKLPLVVAGPAPEELEPLLSGPTVRRVGYTSSSEFERLSREVDVCINLRFPSAGETSAVAVTMMSYAKPVILSATQETSAFPAGTCVRIDTGLREKEELAHMLAWLLQFRHDARMIGANAQEYVTREHAPDRVAALYWEAIAAAA
jgi:hypothetical protein